MYRIGEKLRYSGAMLNAPLDVVEVGMIYRKRTDYNHKAMAVALREAGFTVHDMSKCGFGVPDLIICRGQHCEWLEVKAGPREELTAAERVFFDVCPHGEPILAWSPDLAIVEFERRLTLRSR